MTRALTSAYRQAISRAAGCRGDDSGAGVTRTIVRAGSLPRNGRMGEREPSVRQAAAGSGTRGSEARASLANCVRYSSA